MKRSLHYATKKQSEKAYATGYDKGKSDAVKQQYWLYVSMPKQRNQLGNVRLYLSVTSIVGLRSIRL